MAGLYQCELSERRSCTPTSLYTAAYASAGELAAFCCAWTTVTLRGVTAAAAARAISATVDQLTGKQLTALLVDMFGQEWQPDPLAAGICAMVGVLVALGLEVRNTLS